MCKLGSAWWYPTQGCSNLHPTVDLRVPKPHILICADYDETIFDQLGGVKRLLIADLISISLSLLGSICISICLLVTRVFSSVHRLFISFVVFFFKVHCFLSFITMRKFFIYSEYGVFVGCKYKQISFPGLWFAFSLWIALLYKRF